MVKNRYYYDPIVKSKDNRYYVDYYCTDNKHIVWAGRFIEDSPIEALKNVRNFINNLDEPRPIFGLNSRISQWFWWRKRIRNQKKS